MTGRPPVALVHDYLTQRGGAERVVLTLADAYPGATIHTSLYDPDGTFPGFAAHDVRTLPLDRIRLAARPPPAGPAAPGPGLLPAARRRRRHHLLVERVGPRGPRDRGQDRLLPQSGPVALPGRPVPGRILRGWRPPASPSLSPPLRRWDRRAAATADRYLVNSRAVRARVADVYGIDADVVPPPVDIDVDGPRRAPDGIEPGFVLCVSRLLAYKNVAAVVEAFARRPGQRLVVVGTGPAGRRSWPRPHRPT